MTSGVLRQASDERNLEKQMGCMAGFLQIFNGHQFSPGKRIYGPKRINSFSTTGSTSPSERSDISSRVMLEMLPSSPENMPEKIPPFGFKEGMKNSWKLREAPRLSLDSRLRPREVRTSPANYSVADSDDNQRSPSVIARLMGLDALPKAGKAAGLQRSASESHVSRDLHFALDPPANFATADEIYKQQPQIKRSQPNAAQIQRSYFDAHDFYPRPNQPASRCLYGEIEKRLRVKGIDDPAKDLEALKQILEALQFKGLLRSNSKPSNLISDSPIVVMKPIPKPVKRSEISPVISGHVRRNLAEEKRVPNHRSPRSPNPRRKSLNNQMNGGKISAVHSIPPKSSPRKMSPDPIINGRLNRERMRSPAEDHTTTTNSDSSSLFDQHERSRAGRSLLERCDKLLNSIAEFNSAEQIPSSDQQPSPVSVLDSSVLSESSPSPINKLSIDFKGTTCAHQLVDWEEEKWIGSKPNYIPESEYSDFTFVSSIILASNRYSDSPSDVCYFLEKRHSAADASMQSILHRRLIFDVVFEILDRKRLMSPWESFSRRCSLFDGEQLVKEVWSEVRRSGDDVVAEDLNAAAAGAIKKDLLCGDHWWGDTSAEMSDLVLNVERMVFKDLVVETITDLAGLVDKRRIRNPIPRRKLLF